VGTGFQDFDNDGWKDLFVAQSHVLDNVERHQSVAAVPGASGAVPQRGGKFEKAEPGAAAKPSRDAASRLGLEQRRDDGCGDVSTGGTADGAARRPGQNPLVDAEVGRHGKQSRRAGGAGQIMQNSLAKLTSPSWSPLSMIALYVISPPLNAPVLTRSPSME